MLGHWHCLPVGRTGNAWKFISSSIPILTLPTPDSQPMTNRLMWEHNGPGSFAGETVRCTPHFLWLKPNLGGHLILHPYLVATFLALLSIPPPPRGFFSQHVLNKSLALKSLVQDVFLKDTV